MRDNGLIDGLYVIIVYGIVKSRRKIFGLAAAFLYVVGNAFLNCADSF